MDENKRYGWGHLITLIAVVTVVWAALLLLTPVKAHAGGTLYQPNQQAPYGGCKEAGVNVKSDGARWCRHHGWLVTKRLVVSPNGNAWTGFEKCKVEDGTRCYWNALHVGNGRGHGFIALPGRTVYVDRINGHWATGEKKRTGYWITVPFSG